MTGSRWLTEIKETCLILESVYHLIAHGKQKIHVHQKKISSVTSIGTITICIRYCATFLEVDFMKNDGDRDRTLMSVNRESVSCSCCIINFTLLGNEFRG